MKAVIFDLFGTLIDMPNDSRPYKQLMADLPREQQARARTVALTEPLANFETYLQKLGISYSGDLAVLEQEMQNDIDDIYIFPEVEQTLGRLKESGIKLALISNLATPYKQPFFDLGLDSYFDALVFSCDCGLAKPQPDIYRKALTSLAVAAEQSVMVGDSYRADVEGPAEVGIQGIHLVRRGQPSKASLTINAIDKVSALVGL